MEAIEYKRDKDSGWRDAKELEITQSERHANLIWFRDTAMEKEINEKTKQLKRLEMIEKIKRIKDTLFGLDSPLPKMFTDYNGYFKPRWDKTKTEKEELLCSRHLWE